MITPPSVFKTDERARASESCRLPSCTESNSIFRARASDFHEMVLAEQFIALGHRTFAMHILVQDPMATINKWCKSLLNSWHRGAAVNSSRLQATSQARSSQKCRLRSCTESNSFVWKDRGVVAEECAMCVFETPRESPLECPAPLLWAREHCASVRALQRSPGAARAAQSPALKQTVEGLGLQSAVRRTRRTTLTERVTSVASENIQICE